MTDKEDDNRLIPEPPLESKPEDSRFGASELLSFVTDLANELPKHAGTYVANAPSVAKQYVSEHMDMLTRAITEDNS